MSMWKFEFDGINYTLKHNDPKSLVELIELVALGQQGEDRHPFCRVTFRERDTRFHQQFLNHGGCNDWPSGCEGFRDIRTQEQFILFMSLVHKIEPFDQEILKRMRSFYKMDFIKCLYDKTKMLSLAEEGQVNDAIEIAIAGENLGFPSCALLVNKFAELENPVGYLKILIAVPKTSGYFAEASQAIFDYLQAQGFDDATRNEAFVYLFESGNQRLIDRMFCHMCGGDGLSLEFFGVGLNPETLIALAETIRALRAENEELRQSKTAEIESHPHSFSQGHML